MVENKNHLCVGSRFADADKSRTDSCSMTGTGAAAGSTGTENKYESINKVEQLKLNDNLQGNRSLR